MDIFKKAFLAGIGAVSLSQERLKEIVDELVKNGQLQEQEGRNMIDELMQKAAEVKKDVEGKVQAQINTLSAKVNATSQTQLKKLELRIQELQRQLAKHAAKKPAAGKTKTKTKTAKKTAKKATKSKPRRAAR